MEAEIAVARRGIGDGEDLGALLPPGPERLAPGERLPRRAVGAALDPVRRRDGRVERLEEETFVRRRIGTEVEDQLPAVFNAFGPGERDGPALAPRSGGLDPQGDLSSGW